MSLTREEQAQKIMSVLDNIDRRLGRVERADAEARADAVAEKQKRLARMERDLLAQVQANTTDFMARCDDVLAPYNVRAPMPVAGEDENGYKRRLLTLLQERLPSHHPLYKLNMGAIRGDALDVFAEQVIDAAIASAFDPSSVPHGHIVERIADDPYSGQKRKEYIGDTSFIADPAYGARPGRKVLRLLDPKTGRILVGPPVDRMN